MKKAEIVSLKPEHQSETHFLKRRISVDEFGRHVELDQRYVKSLLDAMAINHCKSIATPGSKGQEGNSATEKLDAKEHREVRSGAGICQYMTEQRFDIAFSTKEIMREAAGPTTVSKTRLKRIACYLKGRQRCVAKHMEVQTMWVQQLNKLGLISLNQLGALENVVEMLTKHVPRAVLDKLAGMMGYSFPGEETAKFQAHSSIDQNFWNQKLEATEKLPIFDDGDNEELEHDVRSFVDKTTHLTSIIVRWCVEMSML